MPIYELTLRAPLHVGEATGIDREATLEYLPSDSLFGAIVSAWATQGVDVDARLKRFSGEPPFRVSSAFPRSKAVRLVSAPAALRVEGLEGKRLRRVRWISLAVLGGLTQGANPDVSDACFLHEGKVWISAAEARSLGSEPLWQKQIVPRVTVDRAANSSNLFHAGRVSYGADGGLWFAARGAEIGWIEEALNILADAGLGGLRNYGHGAFTWRKADDDLPAAPSQGAGLSLARYAPASEDEIRATLQRDGAAYRLITVGGWCADENGFGYRRRAVRLLAEGALLPDVQAARGSLIEVQPEVPPFASRKVYRYALPFFIDAGRIAS